MPIIIPDIHSSPVFYPDSNYQVVKYMDLTRFVSLLQRKSLFFCRLDKLEDHFEGTTAKVNWENRYHFYASQHLNGSKLKKLTAQEIGKQIEEDKAAEEKIKSIMTVCCWNISNSESTALWKIYSDLNQGIMITSKISSIIDSFKQLDERIELSEVNYIDHNNDSMPDSNIMYPVIHKHKAYSYEKELRLIHSVDFGDGLKYDWSNQEVKEGKYLNVDINKLIDEIILSPYSPSWFVKMIEDLCETYALKTTIMRSELSK